jgi:hypothetical protein
MDSMLQNPKKLPLPPYGKEAFFLLSMGVKPRNDIFVYVGEKAWQKANVWEDKQVLLCLPLGENPANYFWPVSDCPILLIDTGKLSLFDIEEIAYYLLMFNAEIVRALPVNKPMVIYRRNSA